MKKSALLLLLFAVTVQVTAQNEIKQKTVTQTRYTADPAPMVYNDTVYLYTSHDEDDATGFKMLNWLLYTSTDMVNWTEHGRYYRTKIFLGLVAMPGQDNACTETGSSIIMFR